MYYYGSFAVMYYYGLLFKEEGVTSLGLTTAQALGTLRDQLSSLLEQHLKLGQRRSTIRVIYLKSAIFCIIISFIHLNGFSNIWFMQELWAKSFLHHNDRHSCFHWPGAAFMLLVVLGLLCSYGKQPKGRWVGLRVCHESTCFWMLRIRKTNPVTIRRVNMGNQFMQETLHNVYCKQACLLVYNSSALTFG